VTDLADLLDGRLIVSCQASAGSPLDRPGTIAALAESAVLGGAAAVRINGLANIRAVRRRVDVPIIGLVKRPTRRSPVYITPTVDDGRRIADAGADIVAVDATSRPRPDGRTADETIGSLGVLGFVVMADVDEVEAALAAERAGARFIATTLAGYTTRRRPVRPDVELVARTSMRVRVPVIAEGRYTTPAQVRAAFRAGAHAVVIGNAITNPTSITARFVAVTPRSGPRPSIAEAGS
jgi:N-acylglucosamine-6-phosphate 2-epimerase